MPRSPSQPISALLHPPIAIGVAAACLLAVVWPFAAALAAGDTVSGFELLSFLALPIAFGGVGAFLVIRVPDNRIGPLLLLVVASIAVVVVGEGLVVSGLATSQATAAPPPPGLGWAIIAGTIAFNTILLVVLIAIPMVFPTGTFLSPRWRLVAVAAVVLFLLAVPKALFGPLQDDASGRRLANPLRIESGDPLFFGLDTIVSITIVPLFALAVSSLIVRYRRGDTIERLQIRWLMTATGLAMITFSVVPFLPPALQDVLELVGVSVLTAIPVAIGLAIVRYHLYDIDRLISRGIAYTLISLILVAAYASAVIVLQGPLGGLVGNDTVVVALSTLIVASLFQPLRRRIQAAVDRRFDRAQLDADRIARAFGTRIRDEVDIETVLGDLSATVERALRPADVALWVRGTRR